MPGVPIYPYTMYSSDVASLHREMVKFFDFGPTGVIDFEELDQREVDSYANFSYDTGWFDENAVEGQHGHYHLEGWTTQRQVQGLQETVKHYAQHYAQQQAAYDQLQAQHLQYRMRMDNQRQLQNSVRRNVPAQTPVLARTPVPARTIAPSRTATPGQQVPQIVIAPTAPNHNPPNVPQMPAALHSAPVQPVQLPAAPLAGPRPTLPPNLPLPLAQRPPPPAGFTDQPRARMLPGSYLRPITGRPRRNVQWPENIEISLVEIATFCPNWFLNPEVVGRAIRNGWSRENIAKAQLLAEDPTSRDSLHKRSGRIQKQVSHSHRLLEDRLDMHRSNANAFRTHHGMQNDLTANAWNFRHSYDAAGNALEHLGDVPLSALYAHVHTWPTGNDRLLMTQCLEFARQNPGRQLDTSQWNWIVTSQGLATPSPLANGQHRDLEALQRLRQVPNPP
ncbi:hypothetical protein Q7P35_006170 [Cladosporium inversicolor]